jgi:hypothetical protein
MPQTRSCHPTAAPQYRRHCTACALRKQGARRGVITPKDRLLCAREQIFPLAIANAALSE